MHYAVNVLWRKINSMNGRKIKWVEKIGWDDMRDSGLLWYVNSLLHLFGRAIVFDYHKTGRLRTVYFARCRYRGFDNDVITDNMNKLTKYLKKNIGELIKDIRL